MNVALVLWKKKQGISLEVESGKSRDILERGEGLDCKVKMEKLERQIGSSVMVARYYEHDHDPIKAAWLLKIVVVKYRLSVILSVCY